jgi:riboflavin kinase / FMN adenylyltransferase
MIILHGTRAADRPAAVTIGNFDGVHRGHQVMVARTIAAAKARGLRSAVLTFEPHPRELFAASSAPTRLTSLREKLELLASLGIEATYVARFSRRFAALSPQAFFSDLLLGQIAARWVMVGSDFRFGARRSGDAALLQDMARAQGVEVEIIEDVTESGLRVSSSAVRQALAAGDLQRAARLLGRPYSISGRVVRGQQLGRTLGFPTANVQLKHNQPPLLGIYAVRAHGIGDAPMDGVASLGFRPTLAEGLKPTLEVFVFDFSGDLYGRHLRVEFIGKIRDEEKYDGLDALKAAIARDCAGARALLLAHARGAAGAGPHAAPSGLTV